MAAAPGSGLPEAPNDPLGWIIGDETAPPEGDFEEEDGALLSWLMDDNTPLWLEAMRSVYGEINFPEEPKTIDEAVRMSKLKESDQYVFYQAPPTHNQDIIEMFLKKGTENIKQRDHVIEVFRESRLSGVEALPYLNCIGIYVHLSEIENISIIDIHNAWMTHYGDRCRDVWTKDRGADLQVMPGHFFYPGESFPYQVGGPSARLIRGIVKDEIVTKEDETYAISLLNIDQQKQAEAFPITRYLMPLCASMNEPVKLVEGRPVWDHPTCVSESEISAVMIENPNPQSGPNPLPKVDKIMVFPTFVVEEPKGVPERQSLTVYYGPDYPRDQYFPNAPEYKHRPDSLEVLINRVFWEDKWHYEYKQFCGSETLPPEIPAAEIITFREFIGKDLLSESTFELESKTIEYAIKRVLQLVRYFICMTRPSSFSLRTYFLFEGKLYNLYELQQLRFRRDEFFASQQIFFPKRLKEILSLWNKSFVFRPKTSTKCSFQPVDTCVRALFN